VARLPDTLTDGVWLLRLTVSEFFLTFSCT
jgi:hypothetical protein